MKQSALEEENKKVVEFELGDEKHAKLQEWFNKYCVEKYIKKDALIEVADALGISE